MSLAKAKAQAHQGNLSPPAHLADENNIIQLTTKKMAGQILLGTQRGYYGGSYSWDGRGYYADWEGGGKARC